MTTFPTNGDYVQALQHTAVCFHDPDLKGSVVAQTSLGMPRAISGNFASVFSVTGVSGKRYAVKCFTRQVAGQHRRYEAIHGVLASLKKPWQVGFDYVGQGVLVDGQWHAILRMEWVEGSQTLLPWLEQNLANPDRILHVARQFATCVDDLQSAGIAHGDLQHGNLLIDSQSRLRVIDYDGMFVPSIGDLGSNELGLANYQHPRRTNSDFAPSLDRFSAWLIYGSLVSLAANPGLWFMYHRDGDEKLLFGKEDFVPPLAAIARLESLGSPYQEVSSALVQALSSHSLAMVPKFDARLIPPPVQSFVTSQAPPDSSQAWWQQPDALPAGGLDRSPDTRDSVGRVGTGWLKTHEAPLPPVVMAGPSVTARVMGLLLTGVGILAAVFLGLAGNLLMGGLMLLAWATAMIAAAWFFWRRSEASIARGEARRRVKVAEYGVTRQTARLAQARRARDDLGVTERRDLQNLESKRAKFPQARTSEVERETKRLRDKLASVQGEWSKLDASKAREILRELQGLQDTHMRTHLGYRTIRPGVISGFGPTLVDSLAAYGIRTAADIAGFSGAQIRRTGSSGWITVRGIGPTKAGTLQTWYQNVERAARRGMPQSLPATRMQAIDSKYTALKRQKQAEVDAIAQPMAQIKATIDAKYANLDSQILIQMQGVRADFARRRLGQDATVAQLTSHLQGLESELLEARRNLSRYEHVKFRRYLTA